MDGQKTLLQIIDDIVQDILKDFMNVRSVITLGLIFTYIYLVRHNMPAPEYLKTLIDMLIGFWFGEKNGQSRKERRVTWGANGL